MLASNRGHNQGSQPKRFPPVYWELTPLIWNPQESSSIPLRSSVCNHHLGVTHGRITLYTVVYASEKFPPWSTTTVSAKLVAMSTMTWTFHFKDWFKLKRLTHKFLAFTSNPIVCGMLAPTAACKWITIKLLAKADPTMQVIPSRMFKQTYNTNISC